MQRIVSWCRTNGPALGLGGGIAGVAISYVWNSTEQYRMALAIAQGHFRPRKPNEYNENFCIFEWRAQAWKAGTIVALIGLTGTGKSTTMEQALYEAPNPFCLRACDDDLYKAMYYTLKTSVVVLPWLADTLRWDPNKTPQEVVTEVFQKVCDFTGTPVHVGIDVSVVEKQSVPQIGKLPQPLQPEPSVQVPVNFEPKVFVKRLKYFAADAKVARVMFTTSEGLQVLEVNEPRLRNLIGKELPFCHAKAYLRNFGVDNIKEDMLSMIPRTFAILDNFVTATDKGRFCEDSLECIVRDIHESRQHCRFWGFRTLYQRALQGPIGIKDIHAYCGTEDDFVKYFVKTNLFTPTPAGKYELQFSCTHLAVKKALQSW